MSEIIDVKSIKYDGKFLSALSLSLVRNKGNIHDRFRQSLKVELHSYAAMFLFILVSWLGCYLFCYFLNLFI